MLSGILEHTGFMLPHQNAGMFNIKRSLLEAPLEIILYNRGSDNAVFSKIA